MSDDNEKRERSFIKERIAPRKSLKKAVLSVLSAIGLGLLFGGFASLAFFLSQDILNGKPQNETQPSQIIIVRDDTTEPTSSQRPTISPTRSTEDPSASGAADDDTDATKETSGTKAPDKETKDPSEASGSASQETGSASSDETPMNPSGPSLQEVYATVAPGIVNLRITRREGTDWFDADLAHRFDTFGIIIADTPETVYVLTDAANIRNDDVITLALNGYVVYPTVCERDDRTHLCVLSLPRTQFEGEVTVLPLGNSLRLSVGDEVYMAGAPLKVNGSVERGLITNIQEPLPATDGYRQKIYTDMYRVEGGSAFLFSASGEVLGWVTDYTQEEGASIAVAAGISPLKYLIEDALSGQSTPYLGLTCTEVGTYEAVISDMEVGLYVASVDEESPAFEAGIQPGDRFVSLKGNPISGNHTLQIRMDELTVGEMIDVVVARRTLNGYEPLTLTVTVGAR